MAKISILVDTDIFIDYFNVGHWSSIFDSGQVTIYYSIVTKKELLSKEGLRETERQSILAELQRFRMVSLTDTITQRYSALRVQSPSLEKEDALIAAMALVKHLPLITRNKRHFQIVKGLSLFGS